MTALILLAAISLHAAAETAPTPVTGSPVLRSVMDYGATADGTGDNTAAFQRALDGAAAANGGIVDNDIDRLAFERLTKCGDRGGNQAHQNPLETFVLRCHSRAVTASTTPAGVMRN